MKFKRTATHKIGHAKFAFPNVLVLLVLLVLISFGAYAQNRDAFTSITSENTCNPAQSPVYITVNGLNGANIIHLVLRHPGLELADTSALNHQFASNPPQLTLLTDTLIIDWDGTTETVDLDGDTLVSLTWTAAEAGTYDMIWTAESYYLDLNGDDLDSDYDDGEFVITEGPEILDVENTDNICYGDSIASITIDAPTAEWFSIDGGNNYADTSYFDLLPGGNYLIQVMDAAGCVSTWEDNPVVINSPAELVFTNVDFTDVTGCFGNESGSISMNAVGGTGMIFYSINAGQDWYVNGGLFNDLPAGEYELVVKDINACMSWYDNNPVILSEPDEIIFNEILVENVSGCTGNTNGSMDIDAFGGTGQLLYSIDSMANWQGDTLFENLSAGNYYVFAQDQNGCLKAYENNPVVVTEPDPIIVDTVLTIIPTCFGTSDAVLEISAFGGNGDLYYSIDNGINWQDTNYFENLAAGQYQVLVQDDSACTGTYVHNPVIINNPEQLLITDVFANNPACYGSADGRIEILASGGTNPLYYSIDSTNTWVDNAVFENLDIGTYYIFVKDANDCTTEWAVAINLTNPDSLVIDTVTFGNVSCYGGANGNISISASGGTQPYYYSIDNGMTFSDTAWLGGLAAGEYNIVVKDTNECQIAWANNPLVIAQPDSIIWENVSVEHISCNGNFDGSITMEISGGTPDYQYSIDGGINWADTSYFGNLSAGSYLLYVKDQNNCESEYPLNPVEITEPVAININYVYSRDISCELGSIIVSADGGSGDLQYSVDFGVTWQEDSVFTDLQEAGYYIKVQDQNGCIREWDENPVYIQQTDTLKLDLVSYTTPGCYGGEEGSIIVQGSGGAGNLMYSIDFGATWQDSAQFHNVPGGMYYLLVIDENACVADWKNNPLEIYEPEEILITSVGKTNCQCYGDTTGEISISVMGGTGFFNYSIDGGLNWLGYSHFTGLSAGEYEVLVKDSDGCQVAYAANPLQITQPNELVIDSINYFDVSCPTCNDGVIQVFAHGGSGAGGSFRYSINGGQSWGMSSVFTSLPAGQYFIMLKENNCSITWEENPVILGDITALDDMSNDDLKVYPNPARNILNIENNAAFDELLVRNVSGQILIQSSLANGKNVLDVAQLPKAVYILELRGSNASSVVKFIKD